MYYFSESLNKHLLRMFLNIRKGERVVERVKVGLNEQISLTTKELAEGCQDGFISLSVFSNGVDIQRNNVWVRQKATDLIETIIRQKEGLEIPVLTAIEKEDILLIVDGKQRVLTISNFLNDELKLGKLLLEDGRDLSNKYFSELPDDIQEEFLNATLAIQAIPYQSDEQIEELFVRYNSGERLRPIEKMRANLPKYLPFIQEITESDFFTEQMKFTAGRLKRFADVDLALGMIMEECYPGTDHNKKTKEAFVKDLSENFELNESRKKMIIRKVKFLGRVFNHMKEEEEKEVRKKVLATPNRILLYKIVKDCFTEKYAPKDVYEFLKHYFIEEENTYQKIAGNTSTSNKSSLEIRYQHIVKEMDKFIKKKPTRKRNTKKDKVKVTS